MRQLFFALPLLASTFLVGTASGQSEIILSALDLNTQFNSVTIDSAGEVVPAGVEGTVSVPPLLMPGGDPDPDAGPLTTATHSFTVDQLDLVGDGVFDDTVVFSYDVASINGDIARVLSTPFAYGVDGTDDPGDNEIDLGEGLTFSNLAAEVTLGDPSGVVPSLESAVFTFFQSRFPGGGDALAVTDPDGNAIVPLLVPDGGGNDPYNFAATPQTEFTITSVLNANGVGGNGFGVDTLSATFTFSGGIVVDPAPVGGGGDFNGDGVVDCADLDGYVGNIGATVAADATLAPLDIDGDGTITATDADLQITTLTATSNGQVGTFPGDLNCDGTVNVLGDAFALIGSLGTAVTSYAAGDINFDGTVDVLGDAFILIGNLGMTNDQ